MHIKEPKLMSEAELQGSTPNILICDDDADIRAVVSFSLEHLGYQIVEAKDGQEAKDFCTKELPDLIVMDVMMPRMSGTEFVEWFRGEHRESYVPVLMLSALNEIENQVAGLDLGADDYVTKPFDRKELQARVRSLLRVKQLTDQLQNANQEIARMQKALVAKERELLAIQLAGATAHKFGQPITAILLNCHIIEQALLSPEKQAVEKAVAMLAKGKSSVRAVRKECESMRTILQQLQTLDANDTADYVQGSKILNLGMGSIGKTKE